MRRLFAFFFLAELGASASVFACGAPYGETSTERLETSPVSDDAGGKPDDPTTDPIHRDDDGSTPPEPMTDGGADAEPGFPPIVPQCDRGKPFGAPKLVNVSSNADSDSDARLSLDEKQIVFTSDRGTGSKRTRVWTASRASASADFGPPTVLLEDPTEAVYDATLSPNGLLVVFQAGGFSTPARLRVAVRGTLALPFGNVVDLVGANAPGTDERDPSLTPDGKRLVFSRGSGTYDLFTATTNDQRSIANVTPLTELNSGSTDRDPVLTQEGLEIFFSSDRGGAGKLRIHHAKRATTSAPFGPPTPLAELAGAYQYDAPTWTSPDGCVLYFSSDRGGNTIDVWRAARPK